MANVAADVQGECCRQNREKRMSKTNQSANDACPICHGGRMDMRYRASSLDYSNEHYFPIFVCARCGYGKTEDVHRQTDALYVGGCYDEKEKPWHKLIRPLLGLLEQGKLRYLASGRAAGKRLLEIGCGKGRFLEAARKRGFRIYGIEPSPRSFAFASASLGSSVAQIGLEEIDSVSEFPREYDYVMLWHVLEHLSD